MPVGCYLIFLAIRLGGCPSVTAGAGHAFPHAEEWIYQLLQFLCYTGLRLTSQIRNLKTNTSKDRVI